MEDIKHIQIKAFACLVVVIMYCFVYSIITVLTLL
jgi:hypothetical protein